MKKLVMINHGAPGLNGHLSIVGRQKIENVALKLAAVLKGPSGLILSPPGLLFKESAQIISEKLIYFIEEQPLLTGAGPAMLHELLEIVESKAEDNLILVSNFKYCDRFPKYFGEHYLFANLEIFKTIPEGQGIIVDCQNNHFQFIRT